MGSDPSEQIKSLHDESESSKGNNEDNSTSQVYRKDEHNKKETEDEGDSSSSDKPGGEVRGDQMEDTSTNENHKRIADEQIKENIQGNEESQEDGNKDLPSTTEDSGVSLGQGMDDCLQQVSLVCHIQKCMSGD